MSGIGSASTIQLAMKVKGCEFKIVKSNCRQVSVCMRMMFKLLIGTQVVEKIKAVPNETCLLVVDQATDRYFADKGIVISGELSCIEHISCPATKPLAGLYLRS